MWQKGEWFTDSINRPNVYKGINNKYRRLRTKFMGGGGQDFYYIFLRIYYGFFEKKYKIIAVGEFNP